MDVAQEATLICPKPDHTWTLDSSLLLPTLPSPAPTHSLPLHPASSHPSPISGSTFPAPSYPGYSFVYPTPAPLALGLGPTGPTLAQPQWGTTDHQEGERPDHVGA